MSTSFLPNSEDSKAAIPSQADSQTVPFREPLKHLLIGSSKAVTSTIHYLQVIGYADVGDWSQLLPTGNAGEFMSILSRNIVVQ